MPTAVARISRSFRGSSGRFLSQNDGNFALPAVASFGARFLARGNAAVARERGVKACTVVVEYPSLEKATAAYDSAAYAEALKALGDGAVRDLRIVEGLD